MNWDHYIRQFENYLKLECSLAPNSVEAYVHDVTKLRHFAETNQFADSPLVITAVHMQDFLEYINELGMTAHSQARVLSGLKSFFKYLVFEGKI